MKVVCGGIDFSIGGKTVPLMGAAREEMLRRFYYKEDLSPFVPTALNWGEITWEDVDWDTVGLKRLGVI